MKILLLTDMPPCQNFTAGLVLERLVKFLPTEQIAICSIINPILEPVIPPELQKIPHLVLQKPKESSHRILKGQLGELSAFSYELLNAWHVKYNLLPKIIEFARQQRVDKLWVVLEGQTMIRLAKTLSNKLGLPLFTQIWDSFEWWLRDNKIDNFTQKRLVKKFNETIKHSTFCATASWAMSENYETEYNIPTIPIVAGLPREFARMPAISPNNKDEFIISMAGQFYAQAEWLSLINALNHTNWLIADKNIKIRVMGRGFQAFTQLPANFEYLGWHSQEETIKLLAESDLLYMAYWFSEEFYKESSTSFPSKLVTYFASGRPVFCHAPLYSSPSKYIKEHNAGYICDSLDMEKILKVLEKAILNTTSYSTFAQNGYNCFLQDFTLERMKETFFKFLGINN